jgi:hypothetical protein
MRYHPLHTRSIGDSPQLETARSPHDREAYAHLKAYI